MGAATLDGMSNARIFRCFKTSPQIIRLAVLMDVRYPLLWRNVEDLLHKRGLDITHETVRFWWNPFGTIVAAEIWRSQARAMHSFRQRRSRGMASALRGLTPGGAGRFPRPFGVSDSSFSLRTIGATTPEPGAWTKVEAGYRLPSRAMVAIRRRSSARVVKASRSHSEARSRP